MADIRKKISNNKEIVSIAKANIHDKTVRTRLLDAVFKGEGNEARLLSDSLVSKYPYNKEYKRLEDLILDKFYQ